VIITAWSGNMDFTHPDNACLVDFELIPVLEGQYPFWRGQVWAEADIDHAAWHMKRVMQDGALRADLGQRAASYIKEHHGRAKVGAAYARRIARINDLYGLSPAEQALPAHAR